MNDAWHWWRQALENPKQIGQAHLPVSDGHPEQGFYRTRYKGKQWEPVAIWQQGDVWIALRSGKPVDVLDIWNWCCRNPITSEAYDRALDGGGWADDDPTVAAALAGHNVGGVSEIDQLKDEIESARQGAEAYEKIESDEQAGKAQSLRARMNELAGKADKLRAALKKPHFEAGKAVDDEWMPLVKEAKTVADLLRGFIAGFETAKLQERRRLEAERQRAEAERLAEEARAREEAQAALEQGRPAVIPPAPAPLPPPLPPITDDRIKGNYGRAASVATELVVTAITDQDALYGSLREHPDLRACLLLLATRALKAGHTVPGITWEEKATIK